MDLAKLGYYEAKDDSNTDAIFTDFKNDVMPGITLMRGLGFSRDAMRNVLSYKDGSPQTNRATQPGRKIRSDSRSAKA